MKSSVQTSTITWKTAIPPPQCLWVHRADHYSWRRNKSRLQSENRCSGKLCRLTNQIFLFSPDARIAKSVEWLTYRTDDLRVQFMTDARNLSVLQNIQHSCGAHQASSLMVTKCSVPRNRVNTTWNRKRPPSNSLSNKEWRYNSNHPVCLHGMDRDYITFS